MRSGLVRVYAVCRKACGFLQISRSRWISWKRTYLAMTFPVYYRLLCHDHFSLKSEPHLPKDPTDPDMTRSWRHFHPRISRASKNFMETDISGDGLSCVLSVSMKGSLLYSNLSHILISPRDPTNWDVTWWWRHHTPPISRASKNFMETRRLIFLCTIRYHAMIPFTLKLEPHLNPTTLRPQTQILPGSDVTLPLPSLVHPKLLWKST